MTYDKRLYCLLLVLCVMVSFPVCAQGQATTLYRSVEQALAFSPELQALDYNNEAIEYDLVRARARYFPSVDLLLGYGTEQHSDKDTRGLNADPSASEWDSRGDASLRLTQKVYDGGETRQNISIQKALLESSNLSLKAATQAIALEAISAHLDVYRQRELVALAEKDLQVHQDIYRALSDIEKAGAGNIADVTQTKARLAQVQSILVISQSNLRAASYKYERIIGVKPGELAFTERPQTLPGSLKDALALTEQNNPELLAFNARFLEAEARVDLARSAYRPKLNLELSSRYSDQLEGDPSWQHTSDAMLVMRWNLFNGGQDKQAINAANARKYQSRSDRDEKLFELRESTAKAWAMYLSLQDQKKAYHDAVASSAKTFDAYLKQFSVSRRSLLDVLNAEKEYFQSTRELVVVSVDEIITAYRILSLGGNLQVQETSGAENVNGEFSHLAQAIVLPAAFRSSMDPSPAAKPHRTQDLNGHSPNAGDRPASATRVQSGATTGQEPFQSIEIGPIVDGHLATEVLNRLQDRGLEVRLKEATINIEVTRLLEGRYGHEAAYARLAVLQQLTDAFIMPENGQFAIYLGSFKNQKNAVQYAQQLAKKNITVTPLVVEIEAPAKMLIARTADRTSVEMIAEEMGEFGISTKATGTQDSTRRR